MRPVVLLGPQRGEGLGGSDAAVVAERLQRGPVGEHVDAAVAVDLAVEAVGMPAEPAVIHLLRRPLVTHSPLLLARLDRVQRVLHRLPLRAGADRGHGPLDAAGPAEALVFRGVGEDLDAVVAVDFDVEAVVARRGKLAGCMGLLVLRFIAGAHPAAVDRAAGERSRQHRHPYPSQSLPHVVAMIRHRSG
jgi:hypothetical protein